MGTASADKTARIWGVDSGRCLTFYTGHTGSVNGISFHPTQDLVLTASGDGSAHIWKASPILPEGLISGDHKNLGTCVIGERGHLKDPVNIAIT